MLDRRYSTVGSNVAAPPLSAAGGNMLKRCSPGAARARVHAEFACTSVPFRILPCKSMQSQAFAFA